MRPHLLNPGGWPQQGVPRALGQAASRAFWAQTLGRLVWWMDGHSHVLPGKAKARKGCPAGAWGGAEGSVGGGVAGGVERNVGEENRGD